MRRRIVLSVAGVAALALVLFAVPLGLALKHSYEDDELLKLQRDAVAATRQVDLAGSRGDPIELPRTGDPTAVFDRSNHVIAGQAPPGTSDLAAEAVAAGRVIARTSAGRLEVAVPVLTGERVTGALVTARDDGVVDARTRDAWFKIAGLALLIEAAAALAAVVVSRRLARPLVGLAASARRLGDGDFTVRAPRAGVEETDAVATALDATASRLGAMVAREREFSADASHQLRTPVAALRLELESAELEGERSEHIERSLTEVDRLDRTVAALLSAARDDPGRSRRADLDLALREVEERWRGPLAASGRPLRVARRSEERFAAISETVLGEILQVLLDNTVKHGAGAVSVTVRPAQGAVAIDVGDEGRGFGADPELAFERRAGTGDGHGVGLALARSLARAEGAELTVSRTGPNPLLTVLVPTAPVLS